jgi:hypothetical protein
VWERFAMILYYLENKVKSKDHRYYCDGADIGGEYYAGTNKLIDARFFLDEETAKKHIKHANNWWTKYDFEVKSIEFEDLIKSQKNLKTFFIDKD